jgi:hypothetical protein
MKTRNIFQLLLIATLGMTSCKKDKNTTNNDHPNTETGNLQSLFTSLKSTPQEFSVKTGTYTTITGAGGTLITFHPTSFLDKDDNILPDGTDIKISLIEALDYKSMIANRVQTITQNRQRLISGGAIHLAVSSEQASSVKIASYDLSYITTNNPPSELMALYLGYEEAQPAGNTVMWYDDTTGTTKSTRIDNNTGINNFFSFDGVTSLGWINCDYFYNSPDPKTDIGVAFPNSSFNHKNTEVYVVFPSINSVSSMYNYIENANSFTFGYTGYHIPIGSNIHIMTVTEKDNQYYMYVQKNINVTNNHTVTATPESATLAEITAALQAL